MEVGVAVEGEREEEEVSIESFILVLLGDSSSPDSGSSLSRRRRSLNEGRERIEAKDELAWMSTRRRTIVTSPIDPTPAVWRVS